MKQIEVVAAIIHDDEGRIFATQVSSPLSEDMVIIRTDGNSLAER